MTSSRPPPASANLASPARNHRRPPGPDMTEHLPAGPAPASPAAPARGKPAAGLPAAKKLYIQTHGCQMNEYDSARMADVLAAADGLELTDDVTEADVVLRSEEHTSELKSLMRISYAVFCLKKKTT